MDEDFLGLSLYLKIAEDNGLLTEVVWSSLVYLKDNPDSSVMESVKEGLAEWGL